FYFFDRSTRSGQHEIDDHFKLLNRFILRFDAHEVIEITADRQAKLVCNLFHHSAELILVQVVLGCCLFHAAAAKSSESSSHTRRRRDSCTAVLQWSRYPGSA